MKILILGSMAFAKDMVKIQKELTKLGHDVDLPVGTSPHLKDPNFVDNLDDNLEYCIKNDVMRKNFRFISEHDGVVIVNNRRNDVDGYIGVSALMELGVSHYLGKKIFIYNQIPRHSIARWAHEVAIMQPTILKGDLTKIK
jgi:hypothetical protein